MDGINPRDGRQLRTGRMRLGELDALRGLAALAVSFQHVLLLTGAAGAVLALAALTPLNALFDGTRAVLFFFVLSGFVLAVPFFRGVVSPAGFVAKRAARIYPAYWLALVVSIAIYSISGNVHLTLYSAANFASLLTDYTAQTYNVVFWSLVQEMRLSILFPLLILPVIKLPWRWVLAGTLPLLVAGFLGEDFPGGPIIGSFSTVYYALFFVLGALTAKHIDGLVKIVRQMSPWHAALWLGVAVLVYGALPNGGVAVPVEKAVVGAACVGMIVLALGWQGLSRFLLHPIFQFLGRVSYSYYLLHLPTSKVVQYLVHDHMPFVAPVVTVAASLLLAWVVYRWIEVPSIRFGHRLYDSISARMGTPSQGDRAGRRGEVLVPDSLELGTTS
jgi:peptidoglycan/LPS O-acetylase OafA/YrhL